jgi:sarcosine reductase
MRLTLAIHPVSEIHFGSATQLDGETLTISAEELRRLILEDERLDAVELELVHPGEQCRFGAIFDVVEPRAKKPGDGSDFPGVLGPMALAGRGTTHVLRGAAVSVLGEGPAGPLVEMGGAASEYCPFAKLCHVVVAPHVRPDLPRHVALNARSNAGVKAAAYLARCSLAKPAAETEVYESEGPLEQRSDGRPRIAYIGQVHSRQRVAEVDEQIIYGHNTTGMVPVLMHPNEWLDGAILAGNAGGNIETYFYQNHPIVSELYRWHKEGKIAFVGTIASMAGSNNFDRELNCVTASELTKWNLGADGVVLSKAGGGAPHADMGLTALLCEKLGIRTVVQVGPPNSAPEQTIESATLFNYPEVDAVVFNAGGAYTMFPAAPVERVVASDPAAAESLFALSEFPATRVCGITSQQGAQRLRSFVY